MGLLSKLKKKSIGGKIVGKAIKKDPIASKLIKHDPVGKKVLGVGGSSSKPKTTVGSALKSQVMKTGGNSPAERMSNAAGGGSGVARTRAALGEGLKTRGMSKRFNRP